MINRAVAITLAVQAVGVWSAAEAATYRLKTQMGTFPLAAARASRSLAVAAAPLPQMLAVAEAAGGPASTDPTSTDAEIIEPDSALSLVHFHLPPSADEQAAMAQMGVVVHGHLPDDTLLVSLPDAATRATLLASGEVAAVVAAPVWLSLEPAMLVHTAAGVALAPELLDGATRAYLIEATQAGEVAALMAHVLALGGEVIDHQPGSVFARVRLTAGSVEGLAQLPNLLHIGLDRPSSTCNDIEYGVVQAGPGMSKKGPIWAQGLRGQGQTVGIGDSSFNVQSCFLSGAGKVASLVFFNHAAPTQLSAEMLHGSHVAGIVAGDQGGDGVYQNQDGEAPAATLVLQSIGDGSAENLSPPSDFATLTQGTIDFGGYIHTNSWGDTYNAYTVLSRSIDAAVYSQPKLLVLFANSNSGPNLSTTSSEVNSKNLVAVGAYNALSPQNVVNYSSRGPTADGRIRPHIMMPGDQVVSIDYSQSCGTRTLSGTSMATPAGAGATALIRQYLVDGFYQAGSSQPAAAITSPSGALLKAMLLAGTENMTGSGTNGDIPAMGQGFGRLNLSQLLWFADQGPPTLWLKDAGSADALRTGDSHSFSLSVRAGADLRVVLTWTDPPALPQAAQTLVNDLDLEVEAPDGTLYIGNAMTAALSVAGGSADRLNTEEMVSLSGAAPGTYIVRVAGTAVSSGTQAYALAVRGSLGDRPGTAVWEGIGSLPASPQSTGASLSVTALTTPDGAITLASVAGQGQNVAAAGSGTLPGSADIIDTRVSCQTAATGPPWLALLAGLRLWDSRATRRRRP